MLEPPPRLVPDASFPPYSYVPGRFPHPVSDPAGHQYGKRAPIPERFDPELWHTSRDYLVGVDLFNHGYCWEAHEVWEGLWHACGRRGPAADFLKGLIKLAAAGVKVREGNRAGVRDHLRRAAELFQQSARAEFLGLRVTELVDACRHMEQTELQEPSATEEVQPVFDFFLRPLLSERGASAP